jgi:ABC-type lipoprotein release transport system permease subunit
VSWLTQIAYLARVGSQSRSRLSTFGLLTILTLSSAALVAGQSLRTGGAKDLDAAATAAQRPDLTVWGREPAIRTLLKQPGIQAAGSLRPINGIEFETTGSQEFAIATVTPPPADTVNRLHVLVGRIPTEANNSDSQSVAVEPGIAEMGSTIRLSWLGTTRSYQVVGIVTDFSMCGRPACGVGRIFLTDRAFKTIYGTTDTSVSIKLVDPTQPFDVEIPGITRNTPWPEVRSKLLAADDLIGGFVAGLGVFLFFGSLLVLTGVISAQMISRSREFAITAALGATSRELAFATALEYVGLSVIASFVGWIAGSFAAPLARVAVARSIGWGQIAFHWQQLLTVAAVMSIATIMATGSRIVRATGRPIVRTLRNDAVAGQPRVNAFHLVGGVVGPLALSEVLSRRTRTAAGILGVALAVAGSSTALQLRSTVTALNAPDQRIGAQWDIAAWPVTAASSESFAQVIGPVPGQVASFTIVQLPGRALLANTSSNKKVSGQPSTTPIRVHAQGGDPTAVAVNVVAGRSPQLPGEVLIGTGLAKRANLDIGDSFPFSTRAKTFTGTVVGTYRDLGDGMSTYVRLEQLRTLDPTTPAGSFNIRLRADQDPTAALAVVRQRLAGRGQAIKATHSKDEIRIAQLILAAIGAMIAVLALGQLCSSWLVGTRENRRELSILQALGCTASQLGFKGALSASMTALSGVAVAIPLATLSFQAIGVQALRRASLDGDTFDTFVSPVSIPIVLTTVGACALLGVFVTRMVTASLTTQDLAAY